MAATTAEMQDAIIGSWGGPSIAPDTTLSGVGVQSGYLRRYEVYAA